MDNTINDLATTVASMLRPICAVPIQHQIWDSGEVAEYLRTSKSNFMQYIAPHPMFPRPISVPNTKGKRLQPRWMAMDVIDYMDKCKDR